MADEDLNTSVDTDIELDAQQTDDGPDDEFEDLDADEESADGDDQDGDGTDDDPDLELVDFSVNGKTYKIPKGAQAGVMLQEDYTRKTQEAAATKRELEQQRELITQQAQLTAEELRARGRYETIQEQINEYKDVDWNTLQATNPALFDQHRRNLDALKETREQAIGKLRQLDQQRSQTQRQADAKRFAENADWATKNIKGWSPQLESDLTRFAVDQGMSREFLTANANPLLIGILHKAYLGDQALKRAANVKPKPRAQTPNAPLATVRAKAPGTAKSVASMSVEDHIKAEQRRMQRR
jgi:hypothetical protein